MKLNWFWDRKKKLLGYFNLLLGYPITEYPLIKAQQGLLIRGEGGYLWGRDYYTYNIRYSSSTWVWLKIRYLQNSTIHLTYKWKNIQISKSATFTQTILLRTNIHMSWSTFKNRVFFSRLQHLFFQMCIIRHHDKPIRPLVN